MVEIIFCKLSFSCSVTHVNILLILIEPIQKDQPVLSPRITSEVVNISNTNLENSKSGEVMSTTGTGTGTGTGSGPVLGDMKPKGELW
jgi:hypothetical protein